LFCKSIKNGSLVDKFALKHDINILKDFKFTYLGENLLLHPLKAIFWERPKILLIADLHLGKAAHFRKSGIPIPESVHGPDLDRLEQLCNNYRPDRIIFLGDLFHSLKNSSWKTFKDFCNQKIEIKPELILGNHDILDSFEYSFLQIHTTNLQLEPFILSHKPLPIELMNSQYNLCGHLHPSVKISGFAKQSLRVECFHFGKNHGILPAFGSFTGTSKMPTNRYSDRNFAVTNGKIIPLSRK